MTITSPTTATVKYSIVEGGQVAVPNQTGQAVLQGGVWKVSAPSFQALLKLEQGQSSGSPSPSSSACRRRSRRAWRSRMPLPESEDGDFGAAAAQGGRRPALATLTAVLFLTFLDTTIVSVALADVQSSLHAGVAQLQWVVNGYALTFAGLMLGMGMLGDRLGRKRVMLGGLGVFIGGSLFGALAPTVAHAGRGPRRSWAWAPRPASPARCRSSATSIPSGRCRARALGVVGGRGRPRAGHGARASAACWWASAAGALVFWFNLAAGLLVLLAALVTVPESADPQSGRIDVAGFVLGPVALGAAIFAVIHGETTGYRDPVVDRALRAERRGRPWRSWSSSSAARRPSSTTVVPAAGAVHRLAVGRLRRLLRHLLDLLLHGALPAGRGRLLRLPHGRPVRAHGGRHDRRLGAHRTLGGARRAAPADRSLGCLAAGVGLLATDLALRGHIELRPRWRPALALAGLGFGVAVVPVTSVALAVVPPEHSGMAAGATTTSRELGSVVGVAVLGSLVNGHLTVDLTRRLAELGVPAGFRTVVINASRRVRCPRAAAARRPPRRPSARSWPTWSTPPTAPFAPACRSRWSWPAS